MCGLGKWGEGGRQHGRESPHTTAKLRPIGVIPLRVPAVQVAASRNLPPRHRHNRRCARDRSRRLSRPEACRRSPGLQTVGVPRGNVVEVELAGVIQKFVKFRNARVQSLDQVPDAVARHRPGTARVVNRLHRLLRRLLRGEAGVGMESTLLGVTRPHRGPRTRRPWRASRLLCAAPARFADASRRRCRAREQRLR